MKLNWFFRSILMNEAGDGATGGGGGHDSTALATTGDTSVAVAGGAGDGGEDTALTTTDDIAAADANRRPSQHPALEVLKTHENPEVKKFANTVIRDRAFRRELGLMFPGANPRTAIESLQRDMVSLAGRNWNTPDPRDETRRTGLQKVRDRLAEIEDIDFMFYGGDPRLLEGMTGDDDGKAAFAKLAPAMENKWKEIAPNAWAAKVARQILADMKGAQLTNEKGEPVGNADLPYRAQRLSLALRGDKDGTVSPLDLQVARNELAWINAYIGRTESMATLAPEVFTQATDKADTRLAERERKLAEREAQSRNNEWNGARQIVANQITTKTWNALTKGHNISADDQEECIALFQRRFEQAIKAREPHADDTRRGYIDAEDRDGYLTYEQYLMNTYGVPALKEQVKRMLAKMQPVKPGQKSETTPASGQPQAAAPKPMAGFVKLMAKPPSHVLDYGRMDDKMVKAKQGVLRIPHDGKPAGTRVTW